MISLIDVIWVIVCVSFKRQFHTLLSHLGVLVCSLTAFQSESIKRGLKCQVGMALMLKCFWWISTKGVGNVSFKNKKWFRSYRNTVPSYFIKNNYTLPNIFKFFPHLLGNYSCSNFSYSKNPRDTHLMY